MSHCRKHDADPTAVHLYIDASWVAFCITFLRNNNNLPANYLARRHFPRIAKPCTVASADELHRTTQRNAVYLSASANIYVAETTPTNYDDAGGLG